MVSITCPDENGTICPLMEEAGAGIGIFLNYLVLALPTLLIVFVVLGAIAGVVAAIIFVIKKSIGSVKMR